MLIEMQRIIPIAILVIVLIALAAYFGPPVYRGWLFKRDCNAMLAAVKSGQLGAVIAYIDPSQQQYCSNVVLQHVPLDYQQSIESLKIVRYEESEPGKIWANVIARIAQGEGTGLYEGRLRWLFDGKRWYWDFASSLGAAYSPSGQQQNWIKMDELAALAGQL